MSAFEKYFSALSFILGSRIIICLKQKGTMQILKGDIIMRLLKKPFFYAVIFAIVLTSFTAYVLLDTFVLATKIETVSSTTVTDSSSSQSGTAQLSDTSVNAAVQQAVATGTSYKDDNISVNITTIRKYDTDVYIADVTVSSAEYLKTAFAQSTYGTNVTATTSATASANSAVLAINGDFYGANKRGYVIKNGQLYRDTARDTSYEDLVIYDDGSFGFINESEVSAQDLVADGVQQLFAFGPTLIKDGTIAVSENDEVQRSSGNGNPRTAIGIVDDLHYVFVVSDGRTSESAGLTLYELAQIMKDYGCTAAYNLDGGGSSTMVFNGEVINNPTTNGNRISEREVSDIVYIG